MHEANKLKDIRGRTWNEFKSEIGFCQIHM